MDPCIIQLEQLYLHCIGIDQYYQNLPYYLNVNPEEFKCTKLIDLSQFYGKRREAHNEELTNAAEKAKSNDFNENHYWPEKTKMICFTLELPLQTNRSYEIVEHRIQPYSPYSAKSYYHCNIFDSHCHLDRIYCRMFSITENQFFNLKGDPEFTAFLSKMNLEPRPLEILKKMFPKAFHCFEGCINVITNPFRFEKKYWEWMTLDPNIYLAIGCHPESSINYDELADLQLRNGKGFD